MDKRRPETLPDSCSEIYDPEGAARLMEKELGKELEFGESGRLTSPVAVLPQTLVASSLFGRGLPILLRRVPLLLWTGRFW